jgi:hypothetical protein
VEPYRNDFRAAMNILFPLRTIKLTDRRPDKDVIRPTRLGRSRTQAEAESGAAVRVERFVR